MKKEIIKQLYSAFEQAALEIDGVECWSARELQTLLGYSKWENFANVIDKAKTACENVGHKVSEHFPDVRKTIPMPKGAEKEIDDYLLTRYACYLVAQNGDPRKEQIAFAQTYFAVQTRKAELIEKRLLEVERLKARLDEGMIDEVRNLLAEGIPADNLIYYGLEYKFVTEYITGRLTYDEMFQRLEIAIHQFAKRQMTWFRGMERRGFTIHWIDALQPMDVKVRQILDLRSSAK